MLVNGLHNERPPSLQHHRPARLERCNLRPDSRMQEHGLPDLPVLPLGVDAIRVAHLSPSEVLQPLVTVESSPILPDLSKPLPRLLPRSVDGEGPRGLNARIGHQLVARQRLLYFLLGRAPPQVPGPDSERVRPGERRPQDSERSQQTSWPLAVPEHPTSHHGPGAEHYQEAEQPRGAKQHAHPTHDLCHRGSLPHSACLLSLRVLFCWPTGHGAISSPSYSGEQ